MAAVGTCTMATAGARGGAIHIFSWTTSSDTGAVSGIPITVPRGDIRSAKVVPNLSTTQPTNLFDLTIVDEDGLDILAGGGANLVNTGPTAVLLDPPIYHNGGTLEVTIANAGNSKTGTIQLLVC